jgi:hypothetical protein
MDRNILNCPRNVVALIKGKETWLFLFEDSDISVLIDQLCRLTCDPDANFTRQDAETVTRAAADAAARRAIQRGEL